MSADAEATREAHGLRMGLLGVCGFSLTLPMTRLAVAELDPVFVGLGRSLISFVLASGLLLWRRDPFPGRRYLPSLAVIAFGVIVGFPLLAAYALKYVPASHGAVVTGLLPLGTALCGALTAHERPSAGFWIAAGAGTATVLAFMFLESGFRPAKGDLLMLAAVAVCAVGYAEGGRVARELGGLRVLSWALVVAAPFLAVPAGLSAWRHGLDASAGAWVAFVYMGVVSMFFAFWAWYRGLALGGVARVSQVQLLQPFLTITASWAILGERISPLTLAAAVIVLAIVALGRRASIARAR
jgi:drug/metabolite transporter (DMT)-like permease